MLEISNKQLNVNLLPDPNASYLSKLQFMYIIYQDIELSYIKRNKQTAISFLGTKFKVSFKLSYYHLKICGLSDLSSI